MIKVLTIEREYGSGAAEIAQKLADRLGWKLWDQLLTDEIARHLECDSRHVEQQEERKDPLYYRLFKAFLRGSFEGSQNAPADENGGRRRHSPGHRATGESGGREGNAVIVGRGSAYYLTRSPRRLPCFHLCAVRRKGAPVATGGKERGGSDSTGRDGRPGPRGLHQADTSESIGLPGISST